MESWSEEVLESALRGRSGREKGCPVLEMPRREGEEVGQDRLAGLVCKGPSPRLGFGSQSLFLDLSMPR